MEFTLGLGAIAVLLWAIWKVTRAPAGAPPADDRLAVLESQVALLTRRVWQLEHSGAATPAPISEPEILPEPVFAPEPEPIPQPIPLPIPPPPIEPIPQVSWEARLGENWLLKLGGLILVIGLALLPTYSFGLLGPLGKVLMAAGLSAAFLAAGIFVEGRWEAFRRWAFGLIGIGWAGLYFTAFAAHAIAATRVIDSPAVGFLLLLATGSAMVLHSLRYRDERITGFSFFLAYAAFLIHGDLPIVLPAMSLLTVAALLVSWLFQWRWLVLGDLLLTYGAYIFLAAHPYVISGFGDPILWLLWVAFEAYDLFAIRKSRGIPFVPQLNALGFVSASILAGRQPDWHYGWFLTWATAGFAVSSALRWLLTPVNDSDRLEDELFGSGPAASLLAMSLTLTGAIFLRFDALAQSFALLLEGEFLFWMGWRARQRILHGLGALILGIFLTKLILIDATLAYGARIAWANQKAWVPLAAAGLATFLGNRIWLGGASRIGIAFGLGASLLAGWLVNELVPAPWRSVVYGLAALLLARFTPRDSRLQSAAASAVALIYFATKTIDTPIEIYASLFLAAVHWWLAQSEDAPSWLRQPGLWAAATLPAFLIAHKAPHAWHVPALLCYGIALLLITPLGLQPQGLAACWFSTILFTLRDLERPTLTLLNLPSRIVHGVLVILVHARIGLETTHPRAIVHPSQLAAVLLTALLLAFQLDHEWVSIAWGIAGAAMLATGFFIQQRWLRLGGLSLFGLGILKLFVYDLSSLTGLARILSFIVLGLLLIAASWAYTKFKDRLGNLL